MLSMWSTSDTAGHVREGLMLLLQQGVIDDFAFTGDTALPYRVTIPAGVVPLSEHQARHFMLGAVTAHFGPAARG